MTRSAVLLGTSPTIGMRHLFNGVLADAYQISNVTILNQNFSPVLVINPPNINHVGLGAYEINVPSSTLNTLGNFYDVWNLIPVQGAMPRSLRFNIEVVSSVTPPLPNFNQILNCTLENMTACMLKKYYLWPVWSFMQNFPLSDAVYQNAIDSSISHFQSVLGLPLRQVRVMTPPYSDDTSYIPQQGVDFDELGSLIQYSAVESIEWSNIRLPHSGIIRINGLRGVYGGRVVYTIPNPWIDGNEFKNGFVRVRPTTTGLINQLVDSSGQFLENTLLEARGTVTVPGFWAVDYTYGQKDNQIAKEICDVIMKKAACLMLAQVGMSITRGIQNKSASVDGLSSSISYVTNTERSLFSALQAQYEQDLSPENIMKLRQWHKGPVAFFF